MFDEDLESLSAVELLESAADHRAEISRLEARLLRHAQLFADHNHPTAHPHRTLPYQSGATTGATTGTSADGGADGCGHDGGEGVGDGSDGPYGTGGGRERGVMLGGDGCPEVAEFAPAEFGVLLGVSPGAAAAYIGQALALRHRFPQVWAKVLGGEATPWRACKIATACLALSEEAAASIDRRLARIVDTVTPIRLEKIVKAAEAHAAPEAARAKAEQRAKERGVFVGGSDEYGSKKIFIRAPSGGVIRFNATIASIAEALKLLGDTRPVQARRAEAIGIISDPAYTEELLLQTRRHHLNPSTPTSGPANSTSGPAADVPIAGPARGTPGPTGGIPKPANPATTAGALTPASGPAHADQAGPTADGGRAAEAVRAADRVRTDEAGRTNYPEHIVNSDAAHRAGRAGCPETDGGRGLTSEPGPGVEFGAEDEPGVDAEAEWDVPHPSETHLLDPLDPPYADPVEPFDPALGVDADSDGRPLDAAARRALHARLIQIKHDAYAHRAAHPDRTIGSSHPSTEDCATIAPAISDPDISGSGSNDPGTNDCRTSGSGPSGTRPSVAGDTGTGTGADASAGAGARRGAVGSAQGLRPGGTEIYVHLTDHTLATGTGVLRAETLGPLLAEQLTELVGHAPYTVKPVIDLNQPDSVDAYEIPDRIRERVKLIYPVEVFPYGNRETTNSVDLDHIQPYDPLGPPKQTSTTNLAPLGRFNHRIKTHARGWRVRRLDPATIEWTTPHGFTYHVTPTGTTRVDQPRPRPNHPS